MVRQPSRWSLAFFILFSVGACGGGAPPSNPVAVDGSSTVYPLSSAIGEAFTKANRNVELVLGYLGYGYFDRNRSRVKALSLDDLKDDVGAGPIEPSAANVSRGTYRPLSRPLFIYVNAERLNRPEVKAFVQFYLAQAAGAAERTGVIALTGYASDRVQQRFDKRVGTMYTAPNSANRSLDYLLDQ
jgi:ABC-type phosphate transport system substrate-binding protein